MMLPFKDRKQAGALLAEVLVNMNFIDPVILAIPRGGAVVGLPVAQSLRAPLDLIIPRKIGYPGNPEIAIGAVTPDGTTLFDKYVIQRLGLKENDLAPLVEAEVRELQRRLKKYGRSKNLNINGKTAVLIDDGIATGFTVRAAIKSIMRHKPFRTVLAIPVAPAETVALFEEIVDDLVCLATPEPFYAVGQFYCDFSQTTDQEVIDILENNRKSQG
ncbi:MAG: phosphoribosyltransferase [Bacillota bacterium]